MFIISPLFSYGILSIWGFLIFVLFAFLAPIWHTSLAMFQTLVVKFLPIAQITVSVILVVVVLLQPSTAGVGGSFGGSSGINAFRTKRGFEKALFIATIVLGVLFIALGILAIVFH